MITQVDLESAVVIGMQAFHTRDPKDIAATLAARRTLGTRRLLGEIVEAGNWYLKPTFDPGMPQVMLTDPDTPIEWLDSPPWLRVAPRAGVKKPKTREPKAESMLLSAVEAKCMATSHRSLCLDVP
jgi:hypothetical protein